MILHKQSGSAATVAPIWWSRYSLLTACINTLIYVCLRLTNSTCLHSLGRCFVCCVVGVQVSPADVYAAVMDWFEHLSRPPGQQQQQQGRSRAGSVAGLTSFLR